MVVVLETDNETRSLIGYLMQNNFVKKNDKELAVGTAVFSLVLSKVDVQTL